jgi:hypothetical protein
VQKLCVCLIALALGGCATYGDQQAAAIAALERNEFDRAAEQFSAALAERDRDTALYHLELGMIRHLQGDFAASTEHLNQAYDLRDAFFGLTAAEQWQTVLRNPAVVPYQPEGFELAYISYFQMLNAMLMAQQAPPAVAQALYERARVEARRLDITLNTFNANEGDYLMQASRADASGRQLLRLLDALRGRYFDPDTLRYRDDAWSRFLIGVTYENQREWDNARIAYQQAAQAYEAGFAEQYALGSEPARLAWASVVRMMRTAGGYASEWPRLVAEYDLDPAFTEPLASDEALLLTIEHWGRVAPVGELNMVLHQQPWSRSLMLRPLPTRGGDEGLEQLAWFMVLYADHGIANLLLRYQTGGVQTLLDDPLLSKQIFLGPLWQTAEQIGLLDGIGSVGIRVAVPWYPPAALNPAPSSWLEPGTPMLMMANLEQKKRQQQLLQAHDVLRRAIVREWARNSAVATGSGLITDHGNSQAGFVLEWLGRTAAMATARADTRHWSTLPQQVRVGMLRLPAEAQAVTLRSGGRSTYAIAPEPQQVHLLVVRNHETR